MAKGNGIGWAIKQMLNGKRVRRASWYGKDMFLFYVDPGHIEHPALDAMYDTLPHIAMSTVHRAVIPWLCSQTDLLAIDWEIA